MTRYTVLWSPEAEDELAGIWLRATDRGAVTSAQAAIDRELAVDPATQGTDVAEGLRRLDVGPLRVFFQAIEPDRIFRVIQVGAL